MDLDLFWNPLEWLKGALELVQTQFGVGQKNPGVVQGTLKWFTDVLELFRVISKWFEGSREQSRDTLQLFRGALKWFSDTLEGFSGKLEQLGALEWFRDTQDCFSKPLK